jgi:hypothetical protein
MAEKNIWKSPSYKKIKEQLIEDIERVPELPSLTDVLGHNTYLVLYVGYLQENYPEELAYSVEEIEQLPSMNTYATKVIKPVEYRNVIEDYLL